MSETFPFSGPPAPPAPGDEGGDESGSSRFGGRGPLVIVGGAVATVVLGIAAWLLLFSGGGDGTDPTAAPVRKQVARPSATASGSPSPGATVLPSVTLNGRNPFVPLLTPPATERPSQTTTTTAVRPIPTSVPTEPAFPTPPATSAPSTSTAAPTTPAPAPTTTTPAPTIRLRLSEVSADNGEATFFIGSKKYVVQPQKTFATHFVLVRLDRGTYATVAYGSATIVDMHEGETIDFR